jgi:recombination protein RecA
MGCGGFPRGRVCEIYGPESSGKTTLALGAVAGCQRRGGTAAFIGRCSSAELFILHFFLKKNIDLRNTQSRKHQTKRFFEKFQLQSADAENALDPAYAASLGVDLSALLISQPDYGEQALEITDTLVRSGGVDLIVVDSVAALVPRAELEGGMGDVHMGLQARMMSQALRKLTSSLGRSGAGGQGQSCVEGQTLAVAGYLYVYPLIHIIIIFKPQTDAHTNHQGNREKKKKT